jgi:hypothetical protein
MRSVRDGGGRDDRTPEALLTLTSRLALVPAYIFTHRDSVPDL